MGRLPTKWHKISYITIYRWFLITRRSQVQVLSPQPPRPGLKGPGLFLCYRAAKMQKFFDALFDAAHNIFLCVDKKDRRSHLKIQGPRGLFCVSTTVCAERFSMFLYVICPFFVPKKSGYLSFERPGRRSFLHENPRKIYRRGEIMRDTRITEKSTPRKRFAAVNGGVWLDFGSGKTRALCRGRG